MEQTQGKRLSIARASKGLSQSKLADMIGVSRGVIQNIEYDRANTMPAVITAICNALQIRQKWLEAGEEPMNSTPTIAENIILKEIRATISNMDEKELQFVLDVVRSMRRNLSARKEVNEE